MLTGKRILLVVSGSVAAYKALEFTRLLRKEGAGVTAILTAGGARFVTREALAGITGDRVHDDLWAAEAEIGHIRLARAADLVAVAPASADILARMAAGLTSDLATTVLLATRAPVLVAPAMNPAMWEHPATRANVAALRARGVRVAGPASGAMAEPESGPGRLLEPAELLEAARAILAPGDGPLAGRHVLVTSGPTHEPIDPVRYIANRSSGRQGHAIAAALSALGARVTLVSGPVSVPDPPGVSVHRVETAREMLAACEAALPADAAVMAAAVADWRVAREAGQKLKKEPGAPAPALEMALNPDILATVSAHPAPRRPRLVVGFAAETERVVEHAVAKRARKGCDWIVANDVSGDVMGGAANTVHLVTGTGVEDWPEMPKEEVARRLAARIAEALA
jgi:phosphopantothenoylcysteine decarboxylase/phosphopantothenate--cysteine ligase